MRGEKLRGDAQGWIGDQPLLCVASKQGAVDGISNPRPTAHRVVALMEDHGASIGDVSTCRQEASRGTGYRAQTNYQTRGRRLGPSRLPVTMALGA
jgi:hypothetical protein